MNKINHFKKFTVVAAVAAIGSAQAAVINLTANEAGSTIQWKNYSVGGTLDDGFSYDEFNPTAASPVLETDGVNAAHGRGSDGVDAVFAYTAVHTVLTEASTIVIDLWGRNSHKNRDDNFSVELAITLAGGGVDVVTATGGKIPNVGAEYQRLTFSGIAVGDTITAMRIIGVDTDGDAASNYFTILETRLAAVPEPSSTALLGLGGLALIFRRRK